MDDCVRAERLWSILRPEERSRILASRLPVMRQGGPDDERREWPAFDLAPNQPGDGRIIRGRKSRG